MSTDNQSTTTRSVTASQSGMVSIIVTMIMMIVISLIVLGFGQVASRNQRQVLDRQLASQALYAAETGINDVITLARNGGYADLDATYDKCDRGSADFIAQKGLNGDLGNGISYTCLLVTGSISPVQENVKLGDNRVVHLKPNTPGPITVSWQSNGTNAAQKDATDCPASTSGTDANSFPSQDEWLTPLAACKFGVMRLDIFNGSTSTTNTDDLAASTAGLYIVPAKTDNAPLPSNTISFGGPSVIKAKCDAGTCTALLDTSLLTDYYVRLSSLYEDLGLVSIAGTTPGMTFTGAGIQIDATGKSRDVLKRIQVQFDPSDLQGDTTPGNALTSTEEICKRFKIVPEPGQTVANLCGS